MLLLGCRGRSQELDQVRIALNGFEIKCEDHVQYLGVVIDSNLTWEQHVSKVRQKCFRGLAQIRRVGHSLPVKLKLQLYNALVLPHTDYCSVIWTDCSQLLQTKTEGIQNFGMRVIFGKPPRTPSHDLRTILKWNTLQTRRTIHRLELVHRCLIGLAPPYLQAHCMINASLVTTQQEGMTNFTFLSPKQTF